ncbi:hypothetical protein EYR36_012032 [Pleurotus pulmonarius]|nr:hypothetical protein EYR36_012032 [Pleurotus pulmonarius]
MYLFEQQGIGYQESPGPQDDPNHIYFDGIRAPDSPPPGSREHVTVDVHAQTWQLHDPYQDYIQQREIELDDLDHITHRQVLVGFWCKFNEPRQSHILLAQIWHRTDIGLPRKHQISPCLVCEEWKGGVGRAAPIWLCLAERSVPYFEVRARESVVREVIQLARERWNAHHSNALVRWAKAVMLDPQASTRADEPAENIWHPVTPPRRPIAHLTRKHAGVHDTDPWAKRARKLIAKEEMAAKKRCLMIPADDHNEHAEHVDSEWYDIPAESTGLLNEAGPSGNSSHVADPEIPSEPVPSVESGRPVRQKRPTWKVLQAMPVAIEPVAVDPHPPATAPSPTTTAHEDPPLPAQGMWDIFCTSMNRFRIFREYPMKPTHQPDLFLTPDDLSDIPAPTPGDPLRLVDDDDDVPIDNSLLYLPFRNSSLFRLCQWMWSGSSMKSKGKFTGLIGVLGSPEFEKEDIQDLNLTAEIDCIDDYIAKQSQFIHPSQATEPLLEILPGGSSNEWKEVPIKISIPDGKPHPSNDGCPTFSIPGLHYRSLTNVIRNAISEFSSRHFHYTPFRQYFQPPPPDEESDTPEPTRVYDEIYSSDAMLEAHMNLQQSPAGPGYNLDVQMAFGDDFIQESSLTRQIILKSIILLATIRNLGKCPCPCCLITKDDISGLGTKRDNKHRVTLARKDDEQRQSRVSKVRDWIYQAGHIIKSAFSECLLGPRSEVPTTNVFSERLSALGFNVYDMFVPDLMHDYRTVPTFGKSTIRPFSNNASAMKKLAARDYEDLLQCSIPVFEGLLDELHDNNIQRLLYTFAEWHALAKLCLHTEDTLQSLEDATHDLGKQVCHFEAHTSTSFETKELPKEEAARARRQQKMAGKTKKQPAATASTNGPKPKKFNFKTYKWHAMGDYVRTIRRFGTTDSYSTQPNTVQNVFTLLAEHPGNPALKEFIPKLKTHISSRLAHPNEYLEDDSVSAEE